MELHEHNKGMIPELPEEMRHQEELHQSQKEYVTRDKFLRSLAFLTTVFLVAVFAYAVGFQTGSDRQKSATDTIKPAPIGEAVITNVTNPYPTVDFSLFWKVWDLVKEKYIDRDDLDANKMVYGAINGMLSATGDPYTTFFDPEENQQFQEKISGNFEGIGAEIGMKDSVLTIIAPLDDSPAAKAGLLAGDKIFKVDTADIGSLTLEQAVRKIRGQKGTKVVLTIFREGEEQTRDIEVTRDVIQVKSVKTDIRDDGIGIIRISQFGETTSAEFDIAVGTVVNRKVKGLIIDLRNDPGGLLDVAVDVSSRLLPTDKIVVIEESFDGKRETRKTEGGDRLSGIPTVILINEGSASASEILAGALKDNRPDSVTLVGEKSFGKGSVQQMFSVPGNTSVKITIAHWLTPSGKQINKQGIAPDVEVKMTAGDYKDKKDPQQDKALEILKGKIQ